MRILLTGAAGFIGGAFLKCALRCGHEILALTRRDGSVPDQSGVHVLTGTLANAPWQEVVALRPEACVHAAWIATPGVYLESPENHRLLHDSQEFVTQAAANGVRHFVALGTCAEYRISGKPLREDAAVAPDSTYAKCKDALRCWLTEQAPRLGASFCWARVFYPYGPGEHPLRLSSTIAQKLNRGERVELRTPASVKDYIFIDDLAAALLAAVESRCPGILNLGTGEGVTVETLARTLGEIMKRPNLIEIAPASELDPLAFVVAESARLHAVGWQRKVPLRQGLERLVRSLSKDETCSG